MMLTWIAKRQTPLISMYVYILFRYHESMLECCRPLEEVRKDGIGFDELACLARCNSLRVITKRPMHRHEYDDEDQTKPRILQQSLPRSFSNVSDNIGPGNHVDSHIASVHACSGSSKEPLQQGKETSFHPYDNYCTLEEFRKDIERCCSSHKGPVLIVSYSRKELLQTGDGHFSPIGGYHKDEDKVLILDTARFKYPPHWVDVEMLYSSMCRIDPSKNLTRGWMIWDVARKSNNEERKEAGVAPYTRNPFETKECSKEEQENSVVVTNNYSAEEGSVIPHPHYFTFFIVGNELIPRKYELNLIYPKPNTNISINDYENKCFAANPVADVLKRLKVYWCMQDEDTHSSVKKEGAITEDFNSQVRDSPESKSIDTSNNVFSRALYFRSQFGFRSKSCIYDESRMQKDKMTNLDINEACDKDLKCNSSRRKRVYEGIRSMELYQEMVKELDAVGPNDHMIIEESIPEGLAELYTLLIYIICNDEDQLGYAESSTSNEDISERMVLMDALSILRKTAKFSAVKYPELVDEIEILSSQWKTLTEYCTVVLKSPAIDFEL